MGDTEDSTREVEDGEMDIVAPDNVVGQGLMHICKSFIAFYPDSAKEKNLLQFIFV